MYQTLLFGTNVPSNLGLSICFGRCPSKRQPLTHCKKPQNLSTSTNVRCLTLRNYSVSQSVYLGQLLSDFIKFAKLSQRVYEKVYILVWHRSAPTFLQNRKIWTVRNCFWCTSPSWKWIAQTFHSGLTAITGVLR